MNFRNLLFFLLVIVVVCVLVEAPAPKTDRNSPNWLRRAKTYLKSKWQWSSNPVRKLAKQYNCKHPGVPRTIKYSDMNTKSIQAALNLARSILAQISHRLNCMEYPNIQSQNGIGESDFTFIIISPTFFVKQDGAIEMSHRSIQELHRLISHIYKHFYIGDVINPTENQVNQLMDLFRTLKEISDKWNELVSFANEVGKITYENLARRVASLCEDHPKLFEERYASYISRINTTPNIKKELMGYFLNSAEYNDSVEILHND